MLNFQISKKIRFRKPGFRILITQTEKALGLSNPAIRRLPHISPPSYSHTLSPIMAVYVEQSEAKRSKAKSHNNDRQS